MKPIRFILLIMSIAIASAALAQAPQRFNYQAVARDASGNPLNEKSLAVRISILDGSASGTTVYSETHSATTSKQGLFAIQVGGGTAVSGAFSSIVWGPSPKFLKVEIDPNAGSAFSLLGTSQLLSVPYAFAADKLVTPLAVKDLSDVSDEIASTGDVLKWNGTEWAPEPGGGSLITTAVLAGDGSSGSPLTIAQQSATNGQVLQWNGTAWKPATVSGGVGDNWGSQTVVANTTLTGNGTAGSPIGLASQGATTGQVLRWSGTAWAPGAVTGDNWGTAKVNTSTQFEGDGTPGNPLKLGGNSATVGQSLVWNGTSWTPQFAGGGTLTLPFSQNGANAGSLFHITNSTGNAIQGLTTSNAADVTGVIGLAGNTTGAPGHAGVLGRTISTNTNGYGVYGLHEGSGVGVYGEAKTGNGVGVTGKASGPSGIGVTGTGSTGLYGYSGIANGKGVYATSVATAWAGYFDEKVFISSNATATKATLELNEVETSDRARLRFTNNIVGRWWDVAAMNNTVGVDQDRFGIVNSAQGEILTVSGAGYVGISNVNPQQRLDVNGSIKLTGGIQAGGSFGANGQVLTSNGSGVQWGSQTGVLFNNTYLYDQTATLSNITAASNSLTGLNNMSITFATQAKVIITFSHGQLVSNNNGDVDIEVVVGFTNAAGNTIINRAVINDTILNGKKKGISYTHHCMFLTPGQYLPYVSVGKVGGSGTFSAVHTNGAGQVTIQVIPQ